MSFVPIRFGDWVSKFLKSNPGENAKDVTARLRRALEAYQAGAQCACGEPIWVIGSAEVGNACFTCITGEADPSQDFEIAEACSKPRKRSRNRRQDWSAVQAAPDESLNQGITDDDVPF
jgi:hypothetical protein